MQLRQAEKLEGQRITVAIEPRHVTAPHETVEHSVEFVRAALEPLGDFSACVRPLSTPGQKFENIKTLVERGRAVTVCVVHVHVRSPMNDSCIYADEPF